MNRLLFSILFFTSTLYASDSYIYVVYSTAVNKTELNTYKTYGKSDKNPAINTHILDTQNPKYKLIKITPSEDKKTILDSKSEEMYLYMKITTYRGKFVFEQINPLPSDYEVKASS